MSSNNRELLLGLSIAYRAINAQVKEDLPFAKKRSNLTLLILLYVHQKPQVSQGELGHTLHRDPMTMSQAIRTLQQAGLITSRVDKDDKRVKRLAITRKGRHLSQLIKKSESEIIRKLAKQWGRNSLNQFLRAIDSFNREIDRVD